MKGKGEDQTRKLEANTKIYTKGKENDLLYLTEGNQIKDELAVMMDYTWERKPRRITTDRVHELSHPGRREVYDEELLQALRG